MAQTDHPTRSPTTRPGGRGLWSRLLLAPESGLILVIALMVVGLTLAAPVREVVNPQTGLAEPVNIFLRASNLIGILTNTSFIAILALGTMGVIIAGGIDLSIGSVYALAGVVGAIALRHVQAASHGLPATGVEIPLDGGPPMLVALGVLLLACCGTGGLCGLVNGVATVGLRVHPFIITLGGMAAYRGLAFVITGGQTESTVPRSLIGGFFRAKVMGVDVVPALIMLAVAATAMFVLSMTVFGRRVYAIGGNETAARYAGVPVASVKVWLFVLGGMAAGLSAALAVGFYGSAQSAAGTAYELKAIAAAVVGGVSLTGGRGTALGVLLGALVIQLIENGIIVLGIDSNYTNIIIGLAIVAAVVVDQVKLRLGPQAR